VKHVVKKKPHIPKNANKKQLPPVRFKSLCNCIQRAAVKI